MNIKKKNNFTDEYQNKSPDIETIINNNSLNARKNNRVASMKENKKVGNQDMKIKTVNVNIHNPNINSLGEYIQTINYKTNNNRKKANSSNQNNNRNYFLKQNGNSAKKSQFGQRKEDTKTVENMFNNPNNYFSKVDNNMQNTTYLGLKKRK